MGKNSYYYAWTRPLHSWCDSVGESIVRLPREAKHRRILIVDDEEGFRDGLSDLLGMEGYAVSVARDAVEAVCILPEIKPELILLDLHMPHLDGEAFLRGMGGLQASRKVAVVLMSAKEDLPAIAVRTVAA